MVMHAMDLMNAASEWAYRNDKAHVTFPEVSTEYITWIGKDVPIEVRRKHINDSAVSMGGWHSHSHCPLGIFLPHGAEHTRGDDAAGHNRGAQWEHDERAQRSKRVA